MENDLVRTKIEFLKKKTDYLCVSTVGAYALYLEPWHVDIFDFLDARKNTGAEEKRARDLFLALWIPDLFMRCVEANEKWTLILCLVYN